MSDGIIKRKGSYQDIEILKSDGTVEKMKASVLYSKGDIDVTEYVKDMLTGKLYIVKLLLCKGQWEIIGTWSDGTDGPVAKLYGHAL